MDKEFNNRSNVDEEEYYFNESESTSSMSGFSAVKSDQPMRSSAPIFEQIQRKHIVWVLVGLLAIAVVYKVIMQLANFSDHKKNIQKMPGIETVKLHSMPKLPARPMPTTMSSAPVNTALTTTTTHFSEHPAPDYQQHLTRLDSQLSDLQASLASLEMRVSELDNKLDTQLKQLHSANAHTPSIRRVYVKKGSVSSKHKGLYYVRAIIPGRAWLIQRDGTTTTVSVGDSVAGYGSVEDIDPEQGIVRFSSGDIITYSPSDS